MIIDGVLSEVGQYGKYQKILLFSVCLPTVLPGIFFLLNHFYIINSFSKCCFESLDNVTQTELDDGWCTNGSKEFAHCEGDSYRSASIYTISMGLIIGSIISGLALDRIGSRLCYFILLFVGIIFNLMSVLMSDFWGWLLCRLMVAFVVPILIHVPYILLLELVGPKYRTRVTIMFFVGISSSIVVLLSILVMIKSWRSTTIVTSLPFIALFYLWNFIPESPRLYLSKGDVNKACIVFRNIANTNGKEFNDCHVLKLKEYYFIPFEKLRILHFKKSNLISVFTEKSLQKITIIISLTGFGCFALWDIVYNFMSIYSKNKDLSFVLINIINLPVLLLSWPVLERCGRRKSICVLMVFSSMVTVFTFTFQIYAIQILMFSGIYAALQLTVTILTLFTFELYPTPVRNYGLLVAFVSEISGILIFSVLKQKNEPSVFLIVVSVIIAICGGLSCLILKETKDKPLMENVIVEGETVI